MDTTTEVSATPSTRRGKYRHHPAALKRAVVEQTLQPGASVSRIAREHDVNTPPAIHGRPLYAKLSINDFE